MEINKEVEQKIHQYFLKWREKIFRTNPIDKDKAVALIKKIMRENGQPHNQKVIIAKDSNTWEREQCTLEEYQFLEEFKDNKDYNWMYNESSYFRTMYNTDYFSTISHQRGHLNNSFAQKIYIEVRNKFLIAGNREQWCNRLFHYWRYDFMDLCCADLLHTEFNCKTNKLLIQLVELTNYVNCWEVSPAIILLAERPTEINRDELGRLHNWSSAAVKYRKGSDKYYWHGVSITYNIAETALDTQKIMRCINVELRRLMIEKIGIENFIVQSGAKVVQQDKYGILYKKEFNDDEPIAMVKVVNSTPEPDGTYKDYFIRVPPHFKTARGAVAWTFNVQHQKYKPVKET